MLLRMSVSALWLCCALLSLQADTLSYVVLQEEGYGGDLLRVSADGKQVSVIAPGVRGFDLAMDRSGDYIVSTGAALLRVTRSGKVSTIATAPDGAMWRNVGLDADGNVVVVDALKHEIWRISGDGQSSSKVARYPGDIPAAVYSSSVDAYCRGLLIDAAGNYLLMAEGEDHAAHLYRITPAGVLSPIPLRGAVRRPLRAEYSPDGPEAISGGRLVSDGSGGYLFLDEPHTRNIFRLSSAGVVEKFVFLSEPVLISNVVGMARNPETGELIVGGIGRLLKVGKDGAISLISKHPALRVVSAIVADHLDANDTGVSVDRAPPTK